MNKIDEANAVIKQIEEALLAETKLIDSFMIDDIDALVYFMDIRNKQQKDHHKCLDLSISKLNSFIK